MEAAVYNQLPKDKIRTTGLLSPELFQRQRWGKFGKTHNNEHVWAFPGSMNTTLD